jgi:hypothetical protein
MPYWRSVRMPLFAWMLLLAAFSRVQLDQVYVVPVNDWRFVDLGDLGLKQSLARVDAEFNVEAGPSVKMILMEHADVERLKRGESHGLAAATQIGPRGRLEIRTGDPGDYVVVVGNRSGRTDAAKVHLRVSVDFVGATQISSARQLTVIAISFAVFFGIVTYSARRLWQGVKR